MEERKGRGIVLFPLPLQGHITPMLQLAQILHSNGFSITIIHTHFNSPNPSNYPHFTFCPIPDGLDQSERAMTDVISLISLLNSRCQHPLNKCLEMLMSSDAQENEEPIGCLISDAIFHFTQGVAERNNIPRLVLRTGGASSFRVFAAFNFLKDKGYLPIQDSQHERDIEELAPLKVKDLPVPVISNSDPQSLYQLVDSMVSSTKKSSGLIFNTFDDLEQPSLTALRHDFPSCPIFPVGPFHNFCSNPSSSGSSLLLEDDTCITWLDNQEPQSVIYVSFGSIAAVKETEFNEIAWGLRNSGRPFLWVVRPGSVSNRVEPVMGPDGKGMVVKWAPQMEVLSHPSVSAFWTHCGWNSTLEGISEGVPMICMPCFTDQKVNSRFVCDVWKVGLEIERDGIERGKIEGIIKRLVEEKEGEEIRRRVLGMKKMARDSVREGGSSHHSIQSLVHHILSLESFTFCSH